MAAALGQVQVGDLLMGTGTIFRINDFNPWGRAARSTGDGPRAWNHGSWSGAEFQSEVVVPFNIVVNQGRAGGIGGWSAANRTLTAAFRPRDTDVELRWDLDGAEYLMYGRPRMVEPSVRTIPLGYALTRAAFVCLDPFVYSGSEYLSGPTTMPTFGGGLIIPVVTPLMIGGAQAGGIATLTNSGTADAWLTIRIDGPVTDPSVSVQRADGVTQTLRIFGAYEAGQWLDIDTRLHTVLLNGLAEASRRGQATGDFPSLSPGLNTFRFTGADTTAGGTVTVRWRDTWW
jgi:hypothetical protein